MSEILPEVDDLIALYCLTMNINPEAVSDAQRACAKGSADQAVTTAMYRIDNDADIDPLTVAAGLLAFLNKNHCFSDGNKRLAWKACLNYLNQVCDSDISATEDEAVEFVESVAASPLDVDRVIDWLSTRLIALPSPT